MSLIKIDRTGSRPDLGVEFFFCCTSPCGEVVDVEVVLKDRQGADFREIADLARKLAVAEAALFLKCEEGEVEDESLKSLDFDPID